MCSLYGRLFLRVTRLALRLKHSANLAPITSQCSHVIYCISCLFDLLYLLLSLLIIVRPHSAPVKNADTAEAMVRAAAARGAQVILLQELFEAPYFCQLQRADFFHLATVADVEKNPLLKRFAALAAELQVHFTLGCGCFPAVWGFMQSHAYLPVV